MKKVHILLGFLIIAFGLIYRLYTSELEKDSSIIYLHEKATTQDSPQEVLNELTNNGNSIIVFYADWCKPCKNAAPIIESLSSTFPKICFIKIDIDRFKDIALLYEIKCVPTIIFLQNGQERQRKSGTVKSKEELIEFIKNVF